MKRSIVEALFLMTAIAASAQTTITSIDTKPVTTTTRAPNPSDGTMACTTALRNLCETQNYSGCVNGVDTILPLDDVKATIHTMDRFNIVYNCSGTCRAKCAAPNTNGGGTDTQCPGYCCPLIVDFGDHGYDLTSSAEGVSFDIDDDGVAEKISWTAAGAADAFLALDRNGNGTIDSGAELFGSAAEQPLSSKPNGFAALAVFDNVDRGGNGDGVIDARDSVWASLLLWVDRSHDGVAQSDELARVAASGVNVLLLDVKEAQRRDRWGNRYLYRSSALAEGGLRKIDVVDVFFVPEP